MGFAIFLVAVQAELTQPPFDMPVAESEIVGGYQVEYTGFRFLFFFMAEFGTAFAFAGIASVLFLGGWYVPGLDPTSAWFNLIGPFVMFIKIMAVSALIFWFRFTYPRLREDQLQKLAWEGADTAVAAEHRRHGRAEGCVLMGRGVIEGMRGTSCEA